MRHKAAPPPTAPPPADSSRADSSRADLWLIRHAPAIDGGAMAGRRDVDADCSQTAKLAALGQRVDLSAQDNLITSPARRCQQTALALFGRLGTLDPRLWEQDFGAWEGMAFADLPDIGPLGQRDLARFAPPGGESFADLVARVVPFVQNLSSGRHVIVAHAGVIRACLGLALGSAELGLGFGIAAPSLTRLSRDVITGDWALDCVNWTVA